LNFDVLNTAYQFGAEPLEFNVSRDQATAEGVEHEILHIGQDEKPAYLLSILKKLSPQQCIVFSNFKNNVGRIAQFLKANGIEATAMSSLLSQAQRNKVLEGFKTGKKSILVATDVAARGLDIKGVDLVINYELPDDCEGYVHRIGRTGRAGTSGKAVGLVSDRDVDALQRIENYLKEKVKIGWFEDSEILKEFQPFPRFERVEGEDNFRRPDKRFDSRSNSRSDSRGPKKPYAGGEHRDRAMGRHKSENSNYKNGERKFSDSPRANNSQSPRSNQSSQHTSGSSSSRHSNSRGGQKPYQNQNSYQQKRHNSGNNYKSGSRSQNYRGGKSSKPTGLVAKVKSFFSKLFA
jgi:ATP-dependent RNA helicase RhlB